MSVEALVLVDLLQSPWPTHSDLEAANMSGDSRKMLTGVIQGT